MKKSKKTKYSPKEIDLSLYPEYKEVTGNALFLINGGKKIENSIEAQANAQPGDTVTNSFGDTVTLTEADIKWAQEKCGMTGSPANSSSQPQNTENSSSPNTNPSGPTNSYSPLLQVPDFEDPYKPESDGTFEIDDENKIVSVHVDDKNSLSEEQLEGLINAYSAYYILGDRGYSFKVTEGNKLIKTFDNTKDAGQYLKTITSANNYAPENSIKNFLNKIETKRYQITKASVQLQMELIKQLYKHRAEKGTGGAGFVIDEDGASGAGHAAIYSKTPEGKYAMFEVYGLPVNSKKKSAKKPFVYSDEVFKTNIDSNVKISLLSKSMNQFPNIKTSEFIDEDAYAGCIYREFETSNEMFSYMKNQLNFDYVYEFKTTKSQEKIIYNSAMEKAKQFSDYNLITNNCGTYFLDSLTASGSGINRKSLINTAYTINSMYTLSPKDNCFSLIYNSVPKTIGLDLGLANNVKSWRL